jgi:opacity protein-like surface antigen
VFTNPAGNLITPAQFGLWPPVSGSDTRLIGGGQAGYNRQSGPWVYGLEGDVDGTRLREKSTSGPLSRTTISGTQTATASFSANVDWIASLRARAGYAWDRALLYATFGVAVAGTGIDTTYAVTEPVQPAFAGGPFPGAASSSATTAGWTAGVGGAWAIDRAWSLGVEYRHTDLSTRGYNLGFTDTSLIPFLGPTPGTVHFTTDQVTSRVTWRPWN